MGTLLRIELLLNCAALNNDWIVVPDILHFCLRCRLLWGRINPKEANSKVRNSGSGRLHQKFGWLPLPQN